MFYYFIEYYYYYSIIYLVLDCWWHGRQVELAGLMLLVSLT